MKLPSFQFYPGDWMKDPGLRSVSLEARGLWIDMLCLLFESGRRGYLQHRTPKPVTEEQLARMTGCSAEQVSRLLRELEDSGVFSRTEHGTVYSRRMVKDERVRQARTCASVAEQLGADPGAPSAYLILSATLGGLLSIRPGPVLLLVLRDCPRHARHLFS